MAQTRKPLFHQQGNAWESALRGVLSRVPKDKRESVELTLSRLYKAKRELPRLLPEAEREEVAACLDDCMATVAYSVMVGKSKNGDVPEEVTALLKAK